MRAAIAMVVSAIVQTCAASATGEPVGPLDVRNQDLFSLMFLSFPPQSPATLSIGQSVFSANLVGTSETKVSENIVYDYEIQRLSLTYRRGTGFGEVSVSLPVLTRQNGFMDAIINWWHEHVLGGFLHDRQLRPTDGLRIFVRRNGEVIVDTRRGDGIGDLELFAKRELWNDGRSAGALRIGLKLPTGDVRRYLGSGAIDVGAQFDVGYQLAHNWYAYAGVGMALQGSPTRLPDARRWQDHEMFALEYRATARNSFVLQVDDQSPTWRVRHPRFDRRYRSFTMGVRTEVRRDTLLQLTVSEDDDFLGGFFASHAPDVSVGVGLEWRL